MSRRPFRLPPDEPPFLEVASLGRSAPPGSTRFSAAQIEQIRRTIRRTPEVMVKVTGGGTNPGSVAAHFAYISRKGKLEIETDEGERIAGTEAQRTFLATWHLELSAGQYRGPRDQRTTARETKLVHKIVLSMPAPTPPEKVLAAARAFARENFGVRHRYAMALHADQANPHVHLVVKAEDELARRLHVDKPMLREWRADFARMMREQGIAANATPRVLRGRNKGKARDGAFRAQRRGKSSAIREKVTTIAIELAKNGRFGEPARAKLVETRKAVVANWMKIAETLDRQGEVALAGDVRYFAKHLPPALTDMERLAAKFVEHLASSREASRARQTPDVDAPVR
ncbi:MAG TPA: relaxase/mobilization nuclease domain-containing protein [Terriglobia bacterium]|nr:relaxase/mobilization nuclease domain-containing protein [Terriglobia bacterium]